MLSQYKVRCKNTLFFVSAYAFGYTYAAYGVERADRQNAIGLSYLLRLSDWRPVVDTEVLRTGRYLIWDTHTHTPRAPEERAPYTCILAVSLIPVSDKATSSIWYVCKNKSSSESLYSPPITSLGRLLRDKKDRSRCSIDLYRDASCRPRAWKIRKYTRTHWTSLSVSGRKHAGDDRTTT